MPRDEDRDEDDRDDRPRRRERDRDDDDDDDDRPRRRRRRDDDDDRGDVTGGLIPYKNGMALAAYYCGVFSFIPCLSVALGPLAVVFGFMGLAKASKHPEAKGKGHSIAGIVCGGLTSLLSLAGIVYVAVMAANGK